MPLEKKIKISEDTSFRVARLREAGTEYKVISKCSEIHRSRLDKLYINGNSFVLRLLFLDTDVKAKMTPKTQRRILNEMKKNSRATAKGLKTLLNWKTPLSISLVIKTEHSRRSHCCIVSEVC